MAAERTSSRGALHERIAAQLRRELRACEPGDRLPPDPEQAERLGVSVVTVRDAMRLLVSEGLVTRRRGAGTFVAEPPVRVGRVTIVCEDDILEPVGRTYWIPALRRLQQRLVEADYAPDVHMEVQGFLHSDLVLRSTPEAPLRGVVLFHASTQALRELDLSRCPVPVVSCVEHISPYWVSNDVPGLVREGVRILAENGCRRLALLTPNRVIPGKSNDWLSKHFQAALAQHGLTVDTRLLRGVPPMATAAEARAAVAALWETAEPPPDGIVVTDDSIYPGAAAALRERLGEAADHLLVVTHDNIGSGMACLVPTVRLAFDPIHTADTVVDKLLTLLAGEEPEPPFTVLPFQRLDDHPHQGPPEETSP